MSVDYNDIKFQKPRDWIYEQVTEGKDWGFITNPMKETGLPLDSFLNYREVTDNWKITVDEWLGLIGLEVEDQEKRMSFAEVQDQTVIVSHGEDNKLKANESPTSSWYKYKKVLSSKGFDYETIKTVGSDAEKILQKLDYNNYQKEVIKGLVVGSVQSGKTTNMGALMAMGADAGWNVFIILSGMIDNLRIQTQDRLYKDLSKTNGSVNWDLIEKPSNDGRTKRVPQHLNFSQNQYIIVTLKNSKNLENLIKWLHSDKAKAKQMKVLVIDDESDQASVDTKNATETGERAKINQLILDLVNGVDGSNDFGSMNYVGYTATPYANVLSESSNESLYPKDFIALLSQSRNYLGPCQIFGVEGETNYPGMNIINNTDVGYVNEDQLMRDLQVGETSYLPDGLKDSIGYFLAASASLRINKHGKPVTMLVHNSIRLDTHSNVANAIKDWLMNSRKEVLSVSKSSWNKQIRKFSNSTFAESVPLYEAHVDEAKKVHSFDELEQEIINLLGIIAPINVEGTDYVYHSGIHLIVDNSSNNKITEDNEFFRLVYPDSKDRINEVTPIFLVIGGATLSRGLTLEGLITTYFSRNTGQADSLMQMGRWFGYRINYEAYPRIWMSGYTLDQFRYLSDLDFSLREEIVKHNVLGKTPKDVGIKIKTSPKTVGLKVTSSNKQRGAVETDFDYTGGMLQTTIFANDIDELTHNHDLVSTFIDDLGKPIIQTKGTSNSIYWEGIPFDLIKPLLTNYRFNKRFRMGNNIEGFIEWISKNTLEGNLQNWNVIAVGKGDINSPTNNWMQKHFSWDMVERSKIIDESSSDFRIQSLRGPSDLFRDIDESKIKDPELLKLIKKAHSNSYLGVRESLNLESTPQFFIYKINKDSKSNSTSKNRASLNAPIDLMGLFISIPGGQKNKNYVTHLTIKLEDNNLNNEDDYYKES